jgi:uncharacterized membrane protein HdeD (DUF308 family)
MQRIEALLERAIPWNKEAAWPVILIEGIVAVAIGLLIVIHPSGARDLIIRLIGVYLAVSAILGLVADWRRSREGKDSRYTIGRHGVMAIVGVTAAVNPHVTTLIAWGCILVGLVGLILILAVPDLGVARWGVLVASAVTLIFGFVLFWALATGTFLVAVVGLAVLLVGCLLVVYSIRIGRGLHQTPVAMSA